MKTRVIETAHGKKLYCVECSAGITRDQLGQAERWCIDNIGLDGWKRVDREFHFNERHYAFIFAIRAL